MPAPLLKKINSAASEQNECLRGISRRGVTMLLVVVLLSVLFSISIGIFALVFGELTLAASMEDSFRALYAADEGTERILRLDLTVTPLGNSYSETDRPVFSGTGACYSATLSKTGGITSLSVIGKYQCSGSDRIVKRAFDLTYPTTPGPIAYWKLDDPTVANPNPTNAEDSSGNNNTGTLDVGTMWRTLDGTWTDEALSFNSTRKVSVPESATVTAQAAHPLTITAWIFPTATGNTIVRQGNAGSPATGYELRIVNAAQDLRFTAAFSGGNMVRESGIAFTLNSWQLAAASWDGTNLASGAKLYRYVTTDGDADGKRDGAELLTGTLTNGTGGYAPPPIGTQLSLGNDSAGGRPLNGCIAEVRIWDRVLSAQEIDAIAQSYAPSANPSPCP